MSILIRWIGSLMLLSVALGWSITASAVTVTRSPVTCTSVAGIGTVAWTNPGNAISSDNSFGTAVLNSSTSNYLQCVNYGFTIPANAQIDGITVNVERRSSATPGTRDAAMRLVKAGVIGATDRSTATAYPTSDTVEAHGSAVDLWGTTWTAAEINSATFGAAIAAVKTTGTNATSRMDHIQITIDYTIPVVINTYYPGTANVALGATTITVGAAVGAGTAIGPGDLVLIMQMQDATLDSTNTNTYGDGVAGEPGRGTTGVGGSGLYEYAVATSLVGTTLTITCGTRNAYTNAANSGTQGHRRFQVIRVPVYASLTMGAITALAWNGTAGGVLAFDVTGALNLNSRSVFVDGQGFRGGAGRGSGSGSGANTDFRTAVANLANGSKGEGIAGTPRYVFTAPATSTDTTIDGYPNGSFARGAPGNAGGGGTDLNPAANDQNSGGGGGGNGGSGGLGGLGWCPTFVNTAPLYGCGVAGLVSGVNPNGSTGGFGGAAVASLGATRLTLGGGGGAATTNDSTGNLGALSSSGAAGGGIIMIRAGSLTSTATFYARGSDGDMSIQNDGSGGGGGGGIVMINAGSGMGGVSINVSGGIGGSNLIPPNGSSTPHGPGGGGGGGYALTSAATASCTATGGAAGITYSTGVLFGAYGAAAGTAGSCATTLTAGAIPGATIGAVTSCGPDHFAISIGVATGSTCTVKSITITAQDAANATVTNYTGTINISTSTSHGDWSKITAAGTLTQAVADSGSATYLYAAADNGVAILGLSNQHADSAMTITVVDSVLPATSRTSAGITFSDNVFVITNDAVQVAGRPQAMTAAMWRRDTTTGNCSISPYYTGAKNLKAWLTRDVSDTVGTAPTIGALSLPNAVPGLSNLALTFTAGSVNFNMATTDIGKYVLNLRDDSRSFATGVDIAGSSSTITTRPFALVVSAIKQGAFNNPAASAAGGTVFAKAGSSFQATLGSYLWNTAADTNVVGGDGVPDAGATLAQITANGATPTYRWPTTLAAGAPFTPAAGTLGTLSNGLQTGACGPLNCFTLGVSTPANLSYSEVGSFTMSGSATNFLNSGINLAALVFDNTAGTPLRNGVVGRFIPDHFDTVATAGMPCPTALTCPTLFNGFVYSGQSFTLNVTARNVANGTTLNYDTTLGFSKATTLSAWNAVGGGSANPSAGTIGSASVPAASFSSGTTSGTGTPGAPTYALPNPYPSATPTSPTDVYIRAIDTDSVTSLNGGSSTEGGMKIVSGRIFVANAYGSELLKLPIPITIQYWNGTRWVTSTTDSATTFPTTAVVFSNCLKNLNLPPCKPVVAVDTPPATVSITAGVGSFKLNATGAGNNGTADITINSPTYLPSVTGRAAFGVFKSGPLIYLREVY